MEDKEVGEPAVPALVAPVWSNPEYAVTLFMDIDGLEAPPTVIVSGSEFVFDI